MGSTLGPDVRRSGGPPAGAVPFDSIGVVNQLVVLMYACGLNPLGLFWLRIVSFVVSVSFIYSNPKLTAIESGAWQPGLTALRFVYVAMQHLVCKIALC